MEHYEIQKRCISDLTVSNHKRAYAVGTLFLSRVKFFSLVKLDLVLFNLQHFVLTHEFYFFMHEINKLN